MNAGDGNRAFILMETGIFQRRGTWLHTNTIFLGPLGSVNVTAD